LKPCRFRGLCVQPSDQFFQAPNVIRSPIPSLV
jgi:hypothetical protein